MTYSRLLRPIQAGFTVVELSIVITVIAILAAITMVAYTNIQAEARDSTVRQAAEKFKAAIQQYSIRNGPPAGFGHGSTGLSVDNTCLGGSGNGWAQTNLNHSSYSCTIADLMVANDYLPSQFFDELPPNTNYYNMTTRVFMMYHCGGGGPANRYQLYYSLERPTEKDEAQFIENGKTCGISSPTSTSYYTNYGMRGSLIVDLN